MNTEDPALRRLYDRLADLRRLWRSTTSDGERANAHAAMVNLARRIKTGGHPGFHLDDYLAQERDDAPPASRATAEFYEVIVSAAAEWAGRLIELLAASSAGGVQFTTRRKGRGWVYQLRGPAAEAAFGQFCRVRDELLESNTYDTGGHQGLNDAFDVVEIVTNATVG